MMFLAESLQSPSEPREHDCTLQMPVYVCMAHPSYSRSPRRWMHLFHKRCNDPHAPACICPEAEFVTQLRMTALENALDKQEHGSEEDRTVFGTVQAQYCAAPGYSLQSTFPFAAQGVCTSEPGWVVFKSRERKREGQPNFRILSSVFSWRIQTSRMCVLQFDFTPFDPTILMLHMVVFFLFQVVPA